MAKISGGRGRGEVDSTRLAPELLYTTNCIYLRRQKTTMLVQDSYGLYPQQFLHCVQQIVLPNFFKYNFFVRYSCHSNHDKVGIKCL